MAISDDDVRRLLSDEPSPIAASYDHGSLTDLTIAQLLAETHGHDLHYIHAWTKWLIWQDGRWNPDELGDIEHLAKGIVRRLLNGAVEIEDEKTRNRRIREIIAAERASRIRGSLELARSELGIPIRVDALDADPNLLNVQNGTIDLRTGEIGSARRGDLITKQSPVNHDPEADAPTWTRFLQRVVRDPDARRFLQRAAGYSLLGGNPAQVLLILYGSGANGKSTFLETIRHLFGDYGQQAPPETFLAKHDGIPNDVARLRGARFVSAVEIGEGRRLNEPLIKRMTGGDTMTARFLRAEYFEFKPQFTPWLATNHKPEIRGTDEAIWRRIRLVPFTETIPPEDRDETLPTKLAAEAPGILNWLLEGAIAYQNDGLAEPESVRAATNEYRADQDVLGGFLDDLCELKPDARVLAAPLYTAYRDWSKASGDEPLTSQSLGRRLTERGFGRTRDRAGRGWLGIRLRDGDNSIFDDFK